MKPQKTPLKINHLWILLLACIYPHQAHALVSEVVETTGDITSDVAHAIAEPVGDVTDVGLNLSLGPVQRIVEPRPVAPVVVTEPVVVAEASPEPVAQEKSADQD